MIEGGVVFRVRGERNISLQSNTVLTENAYEYILNQILDGRIKPGESIREDVIAEQMGTSRTPVREAVNQLAQNGFIDYVKRKGLYCVQLSRQELIDLLELRQVLEEFCYIKCTERASKEDIKRMYDHIYAFQALPREEQIKLHTHYDVQFHLMAADISNSRRLIKYINEIETLALIVRKNLKDSKRMEEVIDLSWILHLNIVKAIEEKDIRTIKENNDEHIKLMKDTQLL